MINLFLSTFNQLKTTKENLSEEIYFDDNTQFEKLLFEHFQVKMTQN